jgi:hypothetical protein
MKAGDHVRLTDQTAAQMAKRGNWRSKSKVDWAARTGVVVRRQLYGDRLIGVQWKGLSSIDWWRERLLVVIEKQARKRKR